MIHTIKHNKIIYYCDNCGQEMDSPLDDAGKDDHCPGCGAIFVVPGREEVDQMRQEDARRKTERAQAEVQREVEREKQRRHAQQEQAKRAAEPPNYGALNLLAQILFTFGAVIFILAMLSAGLGIAASISNKNSYGIGPTIAVVVGALTYALLLMAAGQVLAAFRDIARNTWAIRNRGGATD